MQVLRRALPLRLSSPVTAPDPTPGVPVFRLVVDTTDMAARDRYRLAVECGLVEPFTLTPATGAGHPATC